MYRKKTTENKFGYSIGVFLAICGGVYLVFNIIDGWSKYSESNRRLEASMASLAHLEERYEDLKKEKAHASSTTGTEMQIRSKFDLAKPDERIVFITTKDAEEPLPEQKGIKKIFDSFKKIFN